MIRLFDVVSNQAETGKKSAVRGRRLGVRS